MAFKNPLGLADDILRDARRETLNNRINYKGNYENYITGGSHALDNQASLADSNNAAVNIYQAKKGELKNDYTKEPWIEGLNDRYTNPQHNERAGNAPYGSGLNYIHRYTPSTKRGRRASDIFFRAGINGAPQRKETLEQIQKIVNKYEGRE